LLIESIKFGRESKIRIRLFFNGENARGNFPAFFHNPVMKFASAQPRRVEKSGRWRRARRSCAKETVAKPMNAEEN